MLAARYGWRCGNLALHLFPRHDKNITVMRLDSENAGPRRGREVCAHSVVFNSFLIITKTRSKSQSVCSVPYLSSNLQHRHSRVNMKSLFLWSLGFHLFAQSTMAQFNLYPDVDPVKLGAALNISSDCVVALCVFVVLPSDATIY